MKQLQKGHVTNMLHYISNPYPYPNLALTLTLTLTLILELKVIQTPTAEMIANILTNPLQGAQFVEERPSF